MNKKRLLIVVGLGFIVSMGIFLFHLNTISAQECRIVRIQRLSSFAGSPGGIRLEPETILVSQKDCVVWFSRAETEVQVIFADAKQCLDVTKAPSGFITDPQNCYVSTLIPFGGTSSLRFEKKGAYDYEVAPKGGNGLKVKGHIIVE
jgi:hypothetical protein